MGRISELVGDGILILKRPSGGPRLLFNYIKISLLNFFNGRIKIYNQSRFLGFVVHFSSYRDFFVLVRELFVHENYYFEADTDTPKIVDCGANIGGAILYFKWLYPDADILAFEPVPENFGFLSQNVEENKLKNVQLVQGALADTEGSAAIYVRDNMRMASTLEEKRARGGRKVEVKKELLSSYIKDTVDLLKVDVEHYEVRIFEDLHRSGKISLIKEIVMEFSYLYKLQTNSLARLLQIFEENNFDYDVYFGKRKAFEPASSYIIKAKRRGV